MAAVTVASSKPSRSGKNRIVDAILTAPANNDTWVTGLSIIDLVQITPAGAVAAADSTGFTISGGTITFLVIGTARDLHVTVKGT